MYRAPLPWLSLTQGCGGGGGGGNKAVRMRKTLSDSSCFLYAPVECRLVRTRAKTVPAPKPYRIGHLFTHENGDFDAVSVMLRSCAAPRLAALIW